MNTTFLKIELLRILRDPVTMFFTALLPVFFYIIFGASQDYSDLTAGNGNVAMYIMISMAGYGAVTATAGIGGMAAVERMQGWGRQLGLTPLGDGGFVAIKSAVALMICCIPIGLVYIAGLVTGAKGDSLQVWLLSLLILVVGAIMFALYGLIFGLAFRSEAAVSAASGSLVILAFLGNIFFPLSGALLTFAKFTPLYGYIALARYPLTEGFSVGVDGVVTEEALWIPVVNVVVWTLIFAALATWLVRRGRGRQ